MAVGGERGCGDECEVKVRGQGMVVGASLTGQWVAAAASQTRTGRCDCHCCCRQTGW